MIMKKFSKISGSKVNEEPIIEIPKELSELESIRNGIFKLMDDFLTIRSYGSVSPVWRVPIKITGKEMFVEALIDLISDKSFKDQIKVLESLKSNSNDWMSIDNKIDYINDIKGPKYSIHVEKVKKFIDTYGDNDNFSDILEKHVSRIKNSENASFRSIAATEIMLDTRYTKYNEKLLLVSEKFLNKYNEIKGNEIIGKNTDFVAIFNTQNQKYDVYYKGKLLITKDKFDDIKSYLD